MTAGDLYTIAILAILGAAAIGAMLLNSLRIKRRAEESMTWADRNGTIGRVDGSVRRVHDEGGRAN